MVEISAVFVGLIFMVSVMGLIAINEIDIAHSYPNSDNMESNQLPEDKILKALNDMDVKLVAVFSDLKENLGI